MAYLIQGLLLGFAYAMPIGTQNIYVISTAISRAKIICFYTVLVVGFMDISLSLACFFGLGRIMETFPFLKAVLLLLGAIFLFYIGGKLCLSKMERLETKSADQYPVWRIARDLFVVTWFNPQALIDGSMLFGAVNASLPEEGKGFFVLGMCSASLIWFSCLTIAVVFFRNMISVKVFNWINRLCGATLILFAAKLLLDFIHCLS